MHQTLSGALPVLFVRGKTIRSRLSVKTSKQSGVMRAKRLHIRTFDSRFANQGEDGGFAILAPLPYRLGYTIGSGHATTLGIHRKATFFKLQGIERGRVSKFNTLRLHTTRKSSIKPRKLTVARSWSPIVRPSKRMRSPLAPTIQLKRRLPSFASNNQHLALERPIESALSGQEASDQSVYSYEDAAMCQWIARLLVVCILRKDQPSSPSCAQSMHTLAEYIRTLIHCQQYRPTDEILFLAFWYISLLMPNGLLSCKDLSTLDGVLLATRLFVLAYSLAIIWLEDRPLRIRGWVPHYRKDFTHRSAKALEIAALEALGYNLHISNNEWNNWLNYLQQWTFSCTTTNDPHYFSIYEPVGRKICDVLSKSPPSSPSARRVVPSDLTIRRIHVILLSNLAISIQLPEPAPWNPAEDPIHDFDSSKNIRVEKQAPSQWSLTEEHSSSCWMIVD
ncbi:hypothetical protein B0H34DRAFT_793462 [Crassisporium funariophilum]|nr:hypothetical protein B0H34DRAFT_793462 [Crassisporium funariophilum]